MFIENDEHIIIMDTYERRLTPTDFKKLEGCGIKTIFMSARAELDKIFFQDKIKFDVLKKELDLVLEHTNMKVLLPFFNDPPLHLQDFWFTNGIINYADPLVGESIDDVMWQTINYISKFDDRVQLMYAFHKDGEFPWRVNVKEQPVSNEVLANFIVERQRILSSQFNEVWTTFHNTLGWNWDMINTINQTLYKAFPSCQHYRIQYWHFPLKYPPFAGELISNDMHSKYFVGSEYVTGLVKYFDTAVSQKVWGFLTAPIHFYTRYTYVEDWMPDIIREANEKMNSVWNTTLKNSTL